VPGSLFLSRSRRGRRRSPDPIVFFAGARAGVPAHGGVARARPRGAVARRPHARRFLLPRHGRRRILAGSDGHVRRRSSHSGRRNHGVRLVWRDAHAGFRRGRWRTRLGRDESIVQAARLNDLGRHQPQLVATSRSPTTNRSFHEADFSSVSRQACTSSRYRWPIWSSSSALCAPWARAVSRSPRAAASWPRP
jgi:hypothetical protein